MMLFRYRVDLYGLYHDGPMAKNGPDDVCTKFLMFQCPRTLVGVIHVDANVQPREWKTTVRYARFCF